MSRSIKRQRRFITVFCGFDRSHQGGQGRISLSLVNTQKYIVPGLKYKLVTQALPLGAVVIEAIVCVYQSGLNIQKSSDARGR